MPHGFRSQAAGLFDLPEEQVRVVAPHVGGAFGGKAGVLAEHTVAIGVARALGRPTRWVETRSENLVSMPHGRGQVAGTSWACSATAASPACGSACWATPAPTPASAAPWPWAPPS